MNKPMKNPRQPSMGRPIKGQKGYIFKSYKAFILIL